MELIKETEEESERKESNGTEQQNLRLDLVGDKVDTTKGSLAESPR